MKKTVTLIIGAGGSSPYKLPLGVGLRDQTLRICGESHRDSIDIARVACKIDSHRLEEFRLELQGGGHGSVDSHLGSFRNYLTEGKWAMALALLDSEESNKHRLFPPYQPKDHQVLWQLIQKPTWEEFKRSPVRLITFNYDRTIEHYLTRIAATNYDVPISRVADWISKALVLHVHGSLGPYKGNIGGYSVANGPRTVSPSSVDLIELARNGITILPEAKPSSKEFTEAREWLSNSERILFVGFGYHSDNMARLGFHHDDRKAALGTHRGISQKDWESMIIGFGLSFSALRYGSGSISAFLTSAWKARVGSL